MKKYLSARSLVLLSLGWVLLTGGCGSETDTLVPVRGKVFYKGVPLTGGTIVFAPDVARGGNGSLACGEIKADGTYSLKSNDVAGAVPGWHRVTVVALEVDAPGQPPGPPRSLLPAKYRDPELSGLHCEVKGDRGNDIDFHLD